ncbi:hypothetical protein [Streptomyces sp. NPDC059371]|uniref:hypothetical protein n=1 Tax=Streptomyces sp. NPDC059371 TaxID=3346812 RepID=UPI003677CAE1
MALFLGLWGDNHGWWHNREFLTNLLSSFTGLLLGVPFALVVLSHLGSMQADAAIRRAATRRALVVAARFRATSVRGFINPDPAQAIGGLIELRKMNVKLKTALDNAWNDHLDVTAEAMRRNRIVGEAYDARKVVIDQVFALAGEQRQAWLAQVVQDWGRLDRDVRPRLEEVGGRWLSEEAYTAMRKAFRELDNLSAQPMRSLRRTRQSFDEPDAGFTYPSLQQRLQSSKTLEHDVAATKEVIVAMLGILRNIKEIERIATP